MTKIEVPGHQQMRAQLLKLDKEEATQYCDRCWDTTAFPAFMCKKCALYEQPEGYAFCFECTHYETGGFIGKCLKREGIHPGVGSGCMEGEVRLSGESAK